MSRASRSRRTATPRACGATPPADVVRGRVPPTVGLVDERPDGTILTTGADDLDYLAGHLVGLGLPFEVLDPPELRDHLAALGTSMVERHARR